MLKVGITGQNGFIGQHLYNSIGLATEIYQLVDFQKCYFEREQLLDSFVSKCDVIVHLAAMNRHEDEKVIYETNIQLVQKLISSLERTNSNAHVIMSSSSQEGKDNLYGKSKRKGRKLLMNWECNSNGSFSGLIIPNVFGPFGKPNYNSVVATFCHKVASGEEPLMKGNGTVSLIYVGELVKEIVNVIDKRETNNEVKIEATSHVKVSDILTLLMSYKSCYQDDGEIPEINSSFELNLFNTYRCYINMSEHFPVKFKQHTDPRGSFVEIIRSGIGGQVSFSTTLPGVVRGNHFHTRKIERFAVIRGKALVQLRRIGTNEVLDLYLDGNEPSYVDIPIWYTHNIKNIGDEVLYTNFWINEPYDPEDSDTYPVEV